jgi:cell cycle checkpoint protein
MMKEHKILILTGISGCGKSSTIQVLSHVMEFNVIEWINPIDVNALDSHDYHPGMAQQFTDFLIRNCRSGHLALNDTKKSILLVEDLPNVAHLPTRMIVHSAIRRFWMLNHVFPLVFIVSEMGVDGESSLYNEMDVRCLIPGDILPYCATIAFNPIAPTIMKKALKRICEFEFRKASERPSMTILDQFCMESQGDIRYALSSLQFYCLSKNKDG